MQISWPSACFVFFFFNDTATTEIYTLSLHDALPICGGRMRAVPYASAPNRPFDSRGARLQAGEPLLRPAGPQYGAGPGRRHPPRPSRRRRVQNRAALGPRPAHLLPARRAHDGSAAGCPGAQELRESQVPVVGSQHRDRSVQLAERVAEAGRPELPPVPVVPTGRLRGGGGPSAATPDLRPRLPCPRNGEERPIVPPGLVLDCQVFSGGACQGFSPQNLG